MQRVMLLMLTCYSFFALAQDTQLKLYRPFGEVIDQASPMIQKVVQGECLEQSKLMTREDAWRCMVNSHYYDPCFMKGAGKATQVLCPVSPWSRDSILIKVSTPLNNASHQPLDMSRTFPWAIELSNGEHCQAILTEQTFDAMPIHYQCEHGSLLMGYLQRCKAVWTMLEKKGDKVETAVLSRVWF